MLFVVFLVMQLSLILCASAMIDEKFVFKPRGYSGNGAFLFDDNHDLAPLKYQDYGSHRILDLIRYNAAIREIERELLMQPRIINKRFGLDGFDTPLLVAVGKGNENVVKFLVGQGAQVDLAIKNLSPLKCAIYCCNYSMVNLLIELGACVNGNEEQTSPLCAAVKQYRQCESEKKENYAALAIIKLLKHNGARGRWSSKYNDKGLKEVLREAKALLVNAEKQIIVYRTPEDILFGFDKKN